MIRVVFGVGIGSGKGMVRGARGGWAVGSWLYEKVVLFHGKTEKLASRRPPESPFSVLYGPSGTDSVSVYSVRINGAQTKHSNLRLDPETVANRDGTPFGAKPNRP